MDFLFHLYIMAIGFCLAGLIASFSQLMTGRPMSFTLAPRPLFAAVMGVMVRVAAGPVIVMRNAIRGARMEGRAPHWLALSTLISAIWSFFSGVFLLEILGHLPH
ncbi:MAG: hypothetical protein AB7U38_09810 [Hyphomicrobiales bacterium]